MLDLAITGGTVVTPDGAAPLDVGVAGGRIVILADHGRLGAATERVDATGRVVLPGAVDPHVHTNPPAGHENILGRDVMTLAAIHGGTTTILDFVWPDERSPAATVKDVASDWEGTCHTDYSFHVVFSDRAPVESLSDVPGLVADGFPSFKIFTTDMVPAARGTGFKTTTGLLKELLELTAAHGGIVDVHAEDDELVMHEYERHRSRGDVDLVHMPSIHSALSEELAVAHVLRLASTIPGASVYLHHVSSGAGLAALQEHQRRGLPFFGETLAVLTLADSDRYADEDGVKFHVYPSLKPHGDVEALWEGIRAGSIQTFGTDGVGCLWEEKSRSRDIAEAFGGVTGIEPKLPLLYTEMIEVRGFDLVDLARLTSENAARIFGLYPRKGAIRVGSDADLVVIDPAQRRPVRAAQMHEGDYSPWEGREVAGWPTATILRGRVLVRDGEHVAPAPSGVLAHRRIEAAMRPGTTGPTRSMVSDDGMTS